MAVSSDQEIDAFLLGGAVPAVATAQQEPTAPSLTPNTDAELDAFLTNQTAAVSMPSGVNRVAGQSGPFASNADIENAQFQQANQAPGVPLDIEGGADFMTRASLAIRRTKSDQLKYLQNKHGADKIRLSDEGDWIFRTQDDQGKPKDVLVDERNGTFRDAIDLMGSVPEIAASIYAMRKGKLPPWLGGGGKIIEPAVLAAGGYAAAGAVKDIGTRVITPGAPIAPGEIAAERGKEAGINLLLGAGFGKAAEWLGKGFNILRKPMIPESPGLVEQAGKLAADTIAKDTGVVIPSSIAELTGNRGLAQLETFVSNIPGARKIWESVTKKRLASHDQFQRVMLEGKDPKFASEVSQRAIIAIKENTGPLQTAVATAKSDLGKTASAEVASLFPAGTSSKTALELGESLATDSQALYQQFKAKADELYSAVKEAGSAETQISTTALKKRAAQLLDELPATLKNTEEVAYDAYGSPISRETSKRAVIDKLAPEDTTGFLKSIAGLDDKMNLDEVRKIRTRLFDAIGDPQVLPGVGIGMKKQLAGAATETIEQGVNSLPDSTIKQTLQAANKHYRENAPKFLENKIEGLLLPTTVSGAAGRESFVNSLYAGGKGSQETYGKLKEFFGDNSPQIKSVQDYFYSNTLEKITNPVTRTIEIGDVVKTLEKLNPQISKDLFGANADKAMSAARAFMAGEGKVAYDDVAALLRSGQPSSQKLAGLMKAQQALDKAYQNQISKAASEGKLGGLNPDEFVERYIFGNVGIKDLQETMKNLAISQDATLVGDVQRKYLSNLFQKGQKVSERTGDVTQENFTRGVLGVPQREIDPSKFASLLDSGEEQARMQVILGPRKAELMRQFALKLAAEGEVRRKGGEAASLIRGGMMDQMITGFKGYSNVLKYRTVAWALTHPAAYRFLTQSKAPVDFTSFIKSSVLAPEFGQALADDIQDQDELMALGSELNRFQQ